MSTTRIDLSALPFPNVLETLDYETELEACKADLISRDPDLAPVLNYESEPLVKLLQTFAYRQFLKTGQINEKAKALMLAYAKGSDLDHLAANRGIYRKTIIEADPTTAPPTEAVMELDEDLRRRVHLEPESMSAGSEGCYQFWGLSAHGHVKDIAVTTPNSGFVDIWVQSHIDEVAVQTLLDIVDHTLTPSTRRPLTDKVTVKAATPIEWNLNTSLVLFPGPDAEVVKEAAETALAEYIKITNSLGYDVTRSGLFRALHQGGVQNVIILEPLNDIVIQKNNYAKNVGINITITEFRDV
ncbi:baseplate J/gp47 family protein [Acinetobacter sp. NIPH 1852]|uniref:baseplate assembly protein n=1 Tax=Acinetobacter sp. NIPH 1852 TaxID=2923428 RepID=UPI001F4BAED7|nr:baseplate J/gp47 family protein [Acinetobacter sp. NIPH 1852]MCH7306611.1 baseplate J/gp47 family protein [Acinetobacter sp. NIPH 1852]